LATWSLRAVLVALGVALVVFLVGQLWVAFLPVALALILATLLRPPVTWLVRLRFPPGLAAVVAILAAFALIGGVAVLIEQRVAGQFGQLFNQGAAGLGQIQRWLAGPPLNLASARNGTLVSSLVGDFQQRAATIVSTAFTAVSTLTSILVTVLLTIVLTFLFIKDADRFLPWMGRWIGPPAGPHIEAVLQRSWTVLGSFVRTQALVGLLDAVLIGIALLILGVPLALPLMVLIFFAEAFLPVVGAIVMGALCVLVALVGNGITTAVIVLIVVVVVPQIEGNVFLPYLQGRSLKLHPAIVLLAVTAGGEIFGVSGALLAVPVIAVASELARYLSEQANARARRHDIPGVGATNGRLASTGRPEPLAAATEPDSATNGVNREPDDPPG
jgi:putative heme transporter